jgi:spore germination protein KB
MSSDPGFGKISFLQLSMIFLLANGLFSHVIVNPMILGASGRDAWLVPLASLLPAILWFSIVLVIMRRSAQSKLQPWLAERTSPWLSWLLVIPVYVHIYLLGALTLIHTSNWTEANYLPQTPRFALVFVLIVVSCVAALSGIRTIAIGSGVLLPIVFALGYFVAISNTRVKDYAFLQPILEHGWNPVMSGLVYAGGGLSEIVLLVMLQHHIKTTVKWWHLFVLILLIIQIMLGPLLGAITEFGPEEAARQTESPYEQWRLVQIGPFIEHVDFLSVYQWLSGASVRIALPLYLLSDFVNPAKRKTRRWFIIAAALSYFALALLPLSQQEVYSFKQHYFIPGALIAEICMTVLWLIAAILTKPAKERAS